MPAYRLHDRAALFGALVVPLLVALALVPFRTWLSPTNEALLLVVAVVGALAVSAGVWAWGHHSGGHQAEANGKKGVLVSAGAALLLGAANGVVSFFSTLGSQVH